MLHKSQVTRVLWYSSRRRLRTALRIKSRARRWPHKSVEATTQHHAELAQFLIKHLPVDWNFHGKVACEIGCSDCLSIAAHLMTRGCAKVELLEPTPPVLDPLQFKVLEGVAQQGVPVDPTILQRQGNSVSLDSARVNYHQAFMESAGRPEAYDFIFSFDVMEHVEDLPGFYQACARALKKGGKMFHRIDFSGHSEFEDPVPPLDFQTYPNWLFDLMYPPFYRATRTLVSDHEREIRNAGLIIDETRVTRRADKDYLDRIWPQLRKDLRQAPRETVGVLEAIVFSHRP